MFHFKRQSIKVGQTDETDYIVNSERDASSLKNHYLLRHSATYIVGCIGFMLLLIMLACLSDQTAKKEVILNYQGEVWTIPDWLTKPIENEPISLNQFTNEKDQYYGTYS